MDKYELERVSELNKRWARIQVSNVYDALEGLGYPYQCLDLKIRAIAPGQTIVGPAVTLRGHRAPKTPEEAKKTYDPYHIAVNEQVYPGSVLVVEGGGETQSAKIGEFFAWGLKECGANGCVVDGAVRDANELSQMEGFSVFASEISPFPAGSRWFYDQFNMPVDVNGALCSRVTVNPGDWIIGGTDGVLVVPQQIMMQVLEAAEEIEDYEINLRNDLRAGVPFAQARQKWHRKPVKKDE